MVTDPTPQQVELKLAVRGRNEADLLLARLLRDRRLSEQRLQAAGKHDLLKRVTGTSALDRAIESTRVLLQSVGELVDTLRDEPASGAGGAPATNGAADAAPGENGAAGGAPGENGAAPGAGDAGTCEIVIRTTTPKLKAGAAP